MVNIAALLVTAELAQISLITTSYEPESAGVAPAMAPNIPEVSTAVPEPDRGEHLQDPQ